MEELAAVIIGGLISAGTALICQCIDSRRNRKIQQNQVKVEVAQWNRTYKTDIYMMLADELEGIYIAVDPDTGNVDSEEYEEKVESFSAFVENNRGKIALFMPNEIVRELYMLRHDIYKLSSNEEAQRIDWSDLNNTYVMKTIQRVKHLENMLIEDMKVKIPI